MVLLQQAIHDDFSKDTTEEKKKKDDDAALILPTISAVVPCSRNFKRNLFKKAIKKFYFSQYYEK